MAGKEQGKRAERALNIIFDGPPGHDAGRFVEVETDDGRGVGAGTWIERANGMWALRITADDFTNTKIPGR